MLFFDALGEGPGSSHFNMQIKIILQVFSNFADDQTKENRLLFQ